MIAETKTTCFNQYVKQWLQECKKRNARSTYVKYHRLCRNHIFPYFENVGVEEMREELLEEFCESLSGRKSSVRASVEHHQEMRLSPGNIRCIFMIINQALCRLYQQGHIPDPVHYIPRVGKQKNIVTVLLREEQERLEDYMRGNMSRTTLGIYLSLYTGLRLGELCALRWEDFNLEDHYIHIRNTVQRLPVDDDFSRTELMLSSPKSSSSVRVVPVPDFLMELVKIEVVQSDRRYFLLSQKTVPMDPRTMQYRYKRCLFDAGIAYKNFHTLRHTFATRCIMAGMDLKTLSEILGHSDIKITLDYYFHSSLEHKKTQINLLTAYSSV